MRISLVLSLALVTTVIVSHTQTALAVVYMAPEPEEDSGPAERAESDTEFFHLLNYASIPALNAVEEAVVIADDAGAAKAALLHYMRNRTALWAATMPTSRAPEWYFDYKRDVFKIRAVLDVRPDCMWYEDCINTNTVATRMSHHFVFNTGTNCQLDPENLDWLAVASPTCIIGAGGEDLFHETLASWPWVQSVAFAYMDTGDAAYADYIINKVILDFAADHPVTALVTTNSNPWKQNSSAERLRVLLDAYFATLHSAAMTADANLRILRLIWQHGQSFSGYLERSGAGPGDEPASVAAALVMLAAVFPEFRTTKSDAVDWGQCGTAVTPRIFRGSDQWLKKGIQWFEASMVEGGYYRAICGSVQCTLHQAAEVDENGWTAFYSTHYHKVTTRRAAQAFLLMTLNDVWSHPMLTDNTIFALQHRPLRDELPLRNRAMIEALYENVAPDNIALNTGDGLSSDVSHVLALGVALYGDPRWRSRVDIAPPFGLLGIRGIEKFNAVDADGAGFRSRRQAGSDFMFMRSDAHNRVSSDSQLLFFDANDTADDEHSQEDICQVQLFAHGMHMLIDPGTNSNSYGGPETKMAYHNVSMPNGYFYTTLQGAVVPDANVYEFHASHGLVVGVASVVNGSADVVTRSVAYIPGEYAIVVDAYPAEAVGTANTFWHFGGRARSQSATGELCTSTPQVTMRMTDGAAVAKYYGPAPFAFGGCVDTEHAATLYILPSHPTELTTASIEAGKEDTQLVADVPTSRAIYSFDAADTPVREQILFPQRAADFADEPWLNGSLSPDDEIAADRGRRASGFDLEIGETRRDVTLFNHDTPSTPRSFRGGAYSSDAHVAFVQYEDDDIIRITAKDASLVADSTRSLVASATVLKDVDVRFDGSVVNIFASPTEAVVTIHAPATSAVNYNGVAHAFTQIGADIVVALGHIATELHIGPSVASHFWEETVFQLDVAGTDSLGFEAANFDETVTVSASASVELSADNFATAGGNPVAVPLVDGHAIVYARGSTASTSPITLSVSYLGSYGTVSPGTNSNVFIDSSDTRPDGRVTTTLPVSTTTTSTTLLPDSDAVSIFYDGFEASTFDASWAQSGATPAQIWAGNGNGIEAGRTGLQVARFNSDDALILSIPACEFRDIEVTWSRYTTQRSVGDKLYLSWSINNGSTWTVLEAVDRNQPWATRSYQLPSSVDHADLLMLKIHTVNTTTNELGFVDEFFVTGYLGATKG